MKRRLAWASLLFVAGQAVAQVPVPPERPHDVPNASAPTDGLPPYEAKLERLAELLGTLSLLRGLCPPNDGTVWRNKMQDLLASEGTTPIRRDRLAGAFNQGVDGYRLAYRSCTPAAELVITRALAEGARISSDVSARFSGG